MAPLLVKQVRLTDELNPSIAEVVTLAVVDPPTPTVTEEVALTKSVGAVVIVTATKP